MKRILSIASLLLVAACATPEQLAAQRVAQEQADMETCRSYGLRPGSEAFGNCRLQLDLARQQQYYYDRNYYSGYYGPRFGTGIYYLGH